RLHRVHGGRAHQGLHLQRPPHEHQQRSGLERQLDPRGVLEVLHAVLRRPERRYSATECWAAWYLTSSADDCPIQGNTLPLTSFTSNPASSVVDAPATNAPATRRRMR